MQAVLGSWKEIANYLGKGVRTVQRWERYSGLPIHRPSGSSKGVVIAFPAELDRCARKQDATAGASARVNLQRNTLLSAELANRTHELHNSMDKLMKRTVLVMEQARRRRDELEKDGRSVLSRKAD